MPPRSKATKDPVVSAFARLLAKDPRAVVVRGGSRPVDRAGIEAGARAIEALLTAARPKKHEVIALVAKNGAWYLASYLALRRLDLVPLLLDASTPPREQERVGAALRAAAVLRVASDGKTRSLDPADVRLVAIERIGRAAPLRLPRAGAVKVTSGSTGAPRGIAVSPRALIADALALGDVMGITTKDRVLASVPMSHSYGLSVFTLAALARGVPIIAPFDADPLGPAAEHRATVFPTVPAYLQALLRRGASAHLPKSIRLVISAAAPLAPETAREFRARFSRGVHVLYGASECGGATYDPTGTAAERGTVGVPVPGVDVTIRRARGDAEPGGRVHVKSPAAAIGYLPDPDACLGRGRFSTGDRGVLDRGELRLLGRMDTRVNVDGRKVDPTEIERVIGAMPGVDEAVVLGIPDPGRGERLKAVIACDPSALSWREVVSWCREHLAPWKVPKSVMLVRVIPRTERGKVDRAACLNGDAPPAPRPTRDGAS